MVILVVESTKMSLWNQRMEGGGEGSGAEQVRVTGVFVRASVSAGESRNGKSWDTAPGRKRNTVIVVQL